MPQDPQPPNRPPEDTSLLTWLGFRDPFEFGAARPLGALLGCLLTLIVPLLFFGALCAAGAVLWHSIHLALSGSTEGLNLGAGALIAALLGAPFVIWGTVLKHQSLRYQKEGHITDRISKAVEQLGAEKTVKVPKEDGSGSTERTVPNIEVRIGAILSLERIAQDSTKHDKGRDHVRVMEILCAYVRENAPATDLTPTEGEFTTKIPRIDLQMAVTVLGRRSDVQQKLEEKARYRLDLSRSDLDGMDFNKGSFVGAKFNGSPLEAANFRDADLTGAQFRRALLNCCAFANTKMRGVDMSHCKWTRAVSDGFVFANPIIAQVEGADISGLRLNPNFPDAYFGSEDTNVNGLFTEEKTKAYEKMKPNVLWVGNIAQLNTDEIGDLSNRQKLFIDWNPYQSNSPDGYYFRDAFRDRWNLRGWPFED